MKDWKQKLHHWWITPQGPEAYNGFEMNGRDATHCLLCQIFLFGLIFLVYKLNP
jgi:hypothetical protein